MWEMLPPPAKARYLRRLLTNITSIGGKSVDPYSDKKRERAQSGRSSMYYGLSDVCLTFLSTLTGRPDYVTSLVHQCGKFLPFSCVVQVHLKGGPIWPRQHRQKMRKDAPALMEAMQEARYMLLTDRGIPNIIYWFTHTLREAFHFKF